MFVCGAKLAVLLVQSYKNLGVQWWMGDYSGQKK